MTYLMFARWFGMVSVLLSLGLLFNPEDAAEMTKNMVITSAGYIMGGVLPIILGLFTLMFVNTLDVDWHLTTLLTGMLMLTIGMFRVLFVKQWRTLLSTHIEAIPFLFSLFGLMFGVILLYVGYFSTLV